MVINNQPRSFQTWAAIAATPNDFVLDEGRYGLALHATAWGTATLQKLLSDGTTYVAAIPAIAGDGYVTATLPAGQYRLVLAGITALSGEIARIGGLRL